MDTALSISVPDELIVALRQARSITVLTGAGISAESGIPTFRDSQTGLWEKYDPHELATPEAFARNPELVMKWYRWRRDIIMKAEPNPAHYALSAIEQKLSDFHLITQNVDGLHLRAGSKNVIQLHGDLNKLRCSGIRAPGSQENASQCSFSTTEWQEDGIPLCPLCGSFLRPDVVWFGEHLSEDALKAALAVSKKCDAFFSIGTSGMVEPAATLAYEALRSGAMVIEINPHPTPLSVYSQYLFQQPAGQVLPKIVMDVWK